MDDMSSSNLRTAAQQALKALESASGNINPERGFADEAETEINTAITALRAALAQAEPVQEREEFDHGVGADRFKVVRGAYWWHVLIGDSPTKHGKFHTQTGAEEMAALLLREFRNGAFVQHEAALVRAQDAEIERLRAALAKANEQAERFERGWYLRGDALEAIKKHCGPQPSALAAAIVATCNNGLKA